MKYNDAPARDVIKLLGYNKPVTTPKNESVGVYIDNYIRHWFFTSNLSAIKNGKKCEKLYLTFPLKTAPVPVKPAYPIYFQNCLDSATVSTEWFVVSTVPIIYIYLS